MTYDFTRRERDFGRVVFALTLDRKRMTERIVIGRADEARRCLENGEGEVFYDETRPLGSLLLHFESDTGGEWNRYGITLRESYGKVFRGAARWKTVALVSDFLRGKYESGEPSKMFAAVKTWEDYLNCYNMNHGADLLTDKLSMLHKPFVIYGDYRPWRDEAATALSKALRDGESSVELWYPVAKRPFETVVAFSSFLPVVFYYLHKIEEWNYVFGECKVCGKDFLARNRHYELCSDECRKRQAVEAKREFGERAKGDRLEQLDEAAYYYWYNRLRKLRKGKSAKKGNPTKSNDFVGKGGATERADTADLSAMEHSEVRDDAAAAFKVAFDEFRKEAVRRKGEVKRGSMRLAEFADWLIAQQTAADRLMDER